ncbi:MAG: TonB-dependent receptor [Prevotella sp.]|nr:TonB-dependent receptor [Prevotella sp.]
MKTLKTILTIAAFVMALPVAAQTTTIKGILVDSLTSEGLPYATIRVYKKGNTKKAVAMSVTDGDGHIRQELTGRGQFVLSASCIGWQQRDVAFEVTTNGDLDLGTILCHDDSQSLGTVEVIAQKPLVKMETDKMTYNVAEDEDSKTNTVLDMLRKVPMVTVDGQDNITVNGQSNFKVYVDGKPNAMFSSNASMIFKNMPAAAVKNIEVITNPGAAYDAEGTGGVLNIVMNKTPEAQASLNGYNATVRANASTRGWGAGAFVNGQQDRLSFSTNLMYNYQKPGTSDVTMEREQLGTATSLLTMNNTTDTKLPFVMGSLNLGYELDSMSTMNLMLSVTNMNMKNNGMSTTNMGGGLYGQGFSYVNTNDTHTKRTSFSGSVDYQHFFNRERTSSMAVTYQLTSAPTRSEQWSDFSVLPSSGESGSVYPFDLTDRYSDNNEHTTEHTLQTDFTVPLSTLNKLNFGAKYIARLSDSDAKYYLNDVYTEQMSMDYSHNSSIGTAYMEYDGHAGNIGMKAGLRYEHTWQSIAYRLGNTSDFHTNYGNLVPSASLSYSFAPTVNLGLTYNMRIARPGITYLNPYVDRTNPTALTYGNSDLDVEKSHSIGLVFNMYTPKLMLNLKLTQSLCNNGIEQYSFYRDNLLNTTYGNMARRNLTSFNVYASWMPLTDTRIFMNGGVSYTDLHSDALGASNSGWQYNLMGGLQQTLPADFKMSLFAIASSKSYTLQGWSTGFQMLTGSLTKSFFDDRLTVGVQGLVGLSKGGKLNIESYSRAADFTNHMKIQVPISQVSLTVSYTFGNTKKQMKQFQSRVQSDYMEHESNEERINNIGME